MKQRLLSSSPTRAMRYLWRGLLLVLCVLLALPLRAQVDESQVITMTTDKEIGETIWIGIMSPPGWNNYRIEGAVRISDEGRFSVPITEYEYRVTSKTIRIVGSVSMLRCDSDGLISLDVSQNKTLSRLECGFNNLQQLELSDKLEILRCPGNEMTSLDLSKMTGLTSLDCSYNQLSSLDVTKNTKLGTLRCISNRLTSLDIRNNPKLTRLDVHSNQFGEEAMEALVSQLPRINIPESEHLWNGYFVVVNKKNENEQNRISKIIADIAREKGWSVRDFNGGRDVNGIGIEYRGEAEVDESKYITFTTAKAVGEIVNLNIVAEGDVRIEGVQEAYQPSDDYYERAKPYTLTSQTVRIVGDIRGINLGNNKVTDLDVRGASNLEILDAEYNQLKEIDLSQNRNLRELNVPANQLTSLDLRNNTSLEWIDCGFNQLSNLDVSHLEKLEKLWCGNNKTTSLDLSKNINIKVLECRENDLTTLDLSHNVELSSLECDDNRLKELDLTALAKLDYLDCANNQISQLYLGDKLQLKDVFIYGNNIGLREMEIIAKHIATVDLSVVHERFRSSYGFFVAVDKKNPNEGNRLNRYAAGELKRKGWKVRDSNGGKDEQGKNDWRGIPYEGEDFVDESKYITFTTAKAVGETMEFALSSDEDVRFEGAEILRQGVREGWLCRLTSQTVRIVGAVKMIYLEKNRLTSIDVRRNPILERLDVEDNELTQIDVTQNPLLDHLNCNANRLMSLDLTKNPRLIELDCDDNQLTSLDVSQNVALREFDCRRNQITGLDLSKNIDLRQLHCSHNKIKQLDLSGSGALRSVDCSHNELERIMVTPALRAATTSPLVGLDCSHNRLTSLDLSAATKLERLDASHNRLSRLELGQMEGLTSLRVQVNRLGREAMQDVVAKLPKQEHTTFVVVDKTNSEEGNHIDRDAVAMARAKGWQVRDANDGKDASGVPSQDGIPYDGAATDALDTLEARGVRLYPNPATDYIVVEGTTSSNVLRLYSMDGVLVLEQTVGAGERVALDALPRGVYVARVGNLTERIVLL